MTNPTSSEYPCSSATGEEFPDLLRFLNRVFDPHVQPGIEVLYPTFFRPVPDALENLRVIHADGKIVSHVGIHVQELAVGEATLKSGFVGAVATDPDYRGRGYASLLMNEAVRKMRDEEFDLSLLGGFRDYYERFGYEMGGSEYSFMMFRRCIRSGMALSCEVWAFDGAESDLAKIIVAHEAEPFRVKRSLESGRLLLGIPKQKVYCARAGEKFAYAVLRPPRWLVGDYIQASMVDYGGPCDLFFGMLDHLFAKEGYDLLWVHTPAATPMGDQLLVVGQEYYLGALACVRVIHLRRLLEKMRPILNRRLLTRQSVITGAVSLNLTDEAGIRERVTLSIEKDGVGIGRDHPVLPVNVNPLQLVRLLYGLDIPSRGCPWLDRDAARLLDQVLPLDLYVFRTDHA